MGSAIPIIEGAVLGAVASDAYDKVKDKAADATGQPKVEHGPIELHLLVDLVASIEMAIREEIKAARAACEPKWFIAVLTPYNGGAGQSYVLRRQGFKHVSLLSSASFTLYVQTRVGFISFPITAGWNAIDLPDASNLWYGNGAGSTQSQVYIYMGDDSLDIAGV